MENKKKSRSILKGASFFLATFAFCGMIALGSRFIKNHDLASPNYEISTTSKVAYADATASIDKSIWDTFKENTSYATKLTAVTSIVTSLSAPAVQGSIRESIGTNVMVDVNDTVMTIYSTDGTEIYLPADSSQLFYNNHNYFDNVNSLNLSCFNTSNITDMSYMFYGLSNVKVLDLSNFDLRNVVSATYIYSPYNCIQTVYTPKFLPNVNNISSIDLGETYWLENDGYTTHSSNLLSFPTSTVGEKQKIEIKFNKQEWRSFCSNYGDDILNVTSIVTSKSVPSVLGSINVSIGATTHVDINGTVMTIYSTDGKMIYLPHNSSELFCYQYSYQYYEGTPVTVISNRFKNVKTIDLSYCDTSYVTDMASMFWMCTELKSLDLSTFNISGVTYVTSMFSACTNLNTLYLPQALSSTTINLPVTMYDESDLTVSGNTLNVFASNLSTPYEKHAIIADGVVSKVLWNNFKSNQSYQETLKKVKNFSASVSDINEDDKGEINIEVGPHVRVDVFNNDMTLYSTANTAVKLPADISEFFCYTTGWVHDNCFKNITSFNFANFDTSAVTDMSGMFMGCGMTSINLSALNTQSVTDISELFYYCESLQQVTFGSSFDTSKVTDMWGMFYYCSQLQSLNLSMFDTSNVTDMRQMFGSCQSLASITFGSNFDTSKVTDMAYMFDSCGTLATIDVSGFDTSKVTDMEEMFFYCSSLQSLDLSSFDMSGVTNANEMLKNCYNLTSIYMPHALPDPTKVSTIELSGSSYNTTMTYGLASDNYTTRSANLMAFPTSTSTTARKQIVRAQEVTLARNNNSYGTVSVNKIGYFEGDSVTTNGNQLFVNDSIAATATPTEVTGYTTTVSWDLTALGSGSATANFVRTINSHTLTFVLGNGDPDESITQNYGIAVTVPTPTREGYTLTGWSPEAPTTVPDADVTYTAQWEINHHTITYVRGNGQANVVQEYDYGAAVTGSAPADPTRDGYTFTGWSSSAPATMPDQDIVITAQWDANEYTLTLKQDNTSGAVIATYTQDYETPMSYTGIDTTRAGYTFNGWSVALPATMPLGGGEIYATYSPIEYTLTLKQDNASGAVIATYTQGYETAIDYTGVDATRAGYTFNGWSEALPETMPLNGGEIYANYTANNYTMTFIVEGNTYATINQGYESAVTAPTDPTREGYTFAGWTPAVPNTMPLNGGTYTATWNVNSYNATFVFGNGQANQVTSYNYGAAIVAPANPTREGYTFLGWSPEVPETMPAGNATFTAQWQLVNYKIRLVVNGAYYGDAINYNIESDDIEIDDVDAAHTPEGYEFAGWKLNNAGNLITDLVVESGSTGNKTYYAYFAGQTYSIAYLEVNGSACEEALNLTDEFVYTNTFVFENPTRVGYVFGGWYTETSLTNQITQIPAQSRSSDINVYAKWTAGEYGITYRDQGNQPVTGMPATYITTYVYDQSTLLPVPSKTGYTFGGWYTDSACATAAITTIPANTYPEGVTVYAKWTAETYAISYYDEDEEDFSGVQPVGYPLTHTYGVYTTLPTPTREGYNFVGWFEEPECETQISQIGAYAITDNISVYAKWEVATYSITYRDQYDSQFSGTLPSGHATTYVYDQDTTLPTPTKEGYNFVGWYSDAACEDLPIAVIEANEWPAGVTVYALWQLKGYTVTLHTNGGTLEGDDELTVYHGGDYGYLETPTKENYDFGGWYKNADFTDRVYEGQAYTYAGDSDLYAKWTPTVYTITLDVQGNTSRTIDFTVEDEHFTVAGVEKEGFTFLGWTRNGFETVEVYDPFDEETYGGLASCTLVGQYEIIEYTLRFNTNMPIVDEYGNDVITSSEYGELFATTDHYTVNTIIGELPNLDFEEYGAVFQGWILNGEGEPVKDLVVPAHVTGDRVYTAVFEGKPYTLTFNANGGTVEEASRIIHYGDEFGELPVPVKGEIYALEGWYDPDNNKVNPDDLFLLTHDLNLTAQWTLKQFKIKRTVDGLTFVTYYKVNDARITLTNPNKKGYTFLGWSGTGIPEGTYLKNVSIPTGSTGDKQYVAHFEPTVYTVTTIINGQENVREYTIESETFMLDEVDVDGYVFVGWSGTDVSVPTGTITIEQGSIGNRVYVANLTEISYTLTITVDGEDRVIEYTPSSDPIVIQNPKKNGYVFVGWRDEETGDIVDNVIVDTGSSGDKHYTAVWKQDKSSLKISITLFSIAGAALVAGVGLGVLRFVRRKKF